MKKWLPYLKNKFILATSIFVIYTLFLDDYDVFTIINHKSKLKELEVKKVSYSKKLKETKRTLERLKYPHEIEKFAREKKFFKKDDEDVFVIFKE